MSWGNVAMVAASVIGGAISSKGAKDAGKAAAAGSTEEIAFARESRDLARRDQYPYKKAGYTALNALMSMTGLSTGPSGSANVDPRGDVGYSTFYDDPEPTLGPDGRPTLTNRRSAYGGQIHPKYAGGQIYGRNRGGVMYNVNELGPESVYQGGSYTRGTQPRTIAPSGDGYVAPNVIGRANGGMLGGAVGNTLTNQYGSGGPPSIDYNPAPTGPQVMNPDGTPMTLNPEGAQTYDTGDYGQYTQPYDPKPQAPESYAPNADDGNAVVNTDFTTGTTYQDSLNGGNEAQAGGPGGQIPGGVSVGGVGGTPDISIENEMGWSIPTPVAGGYNSDFGDPNDPARNNYARPEENPGGVEGGYNFMTDPGYEFRFQEGQRALERSAAARGGLLSGGFARKMTRYGQDYASNEYTNVYNRISNIAGLGQVSANQSGNAALYAGQQMGGAASDRGIAGAYGAQGSANAWGNALDNIDWGNIFKSSGGGYSGGYNSPGIAPRDTGSNYGPPRP